MTFSGARRIARRSFVGGAASFFALPALPAVARPPLRDTPMFCYVGSYTPNGPGITLFRVDPSSGVLTFVRGFDGIVSPTWLALNSARTLLFATSEMTDGSVSSYAVDRVSGELLLRSRVSSGGGQPVHLSVHRTDRYLFVGNYASGTIAIIPIGSDGTLGAASLVEMDRGPGRPPRAADDPPGNFAGSDHRHAHVHMIATDPAGRFLFVNDAGLDTTFVWTFDPSNGTAVPAPTPMFAAPSGSAPRHFAFHPNSQHWYNLYEQDSMLAVYDYDADTGSVSRTQLISLLPSGFAGSSLASEVVVTADGRFVYAATRLHDSIAMFRVLRDGRLEPIGEEWTRADYPRSIALDPSGNFLFACNQHADAITTFRIDSQTGALGFTGAYTAVGSPATMVFL